MNIGHHCQFSLAPIQLRLTHKFHTSWSSRKHRRWWYAVVSQLYEVVLLNNLKAGTWFSWVCSFQRCHDCDGVEINEQIEQIRYWTSSSFCSLRSSSRWRAFCARACVQRACGVGGLKLGSVGLRGHHFLMARYGQHISHFLNSGKVAAPQWWASFFSGLHDCSQVHCII